MTSRSRVIGLGAFGDKNTTIGFPPLIGLRRQEHYPEQLDRIDGRQLSLRFQECVSDQSVPGSPLILISVQVFS
jgi:hypothetical protein